MEKNLNSIKLLEKILKIGKIINQKEHQIKEINLVGDYPILLPEIDVAKSISISLNYIYKDYQCDDWVYNTVFDYFEDKITLQETINILLTQEE